MSASSRKNLVLTASKIALLAASTTLSSCGGMNMFSSAQGISSRDFVAPEQQDVVGGAAYWGARYEANREDIPAAVAFARNLRMMGGSQQAVTLLKDVVIKAPDNASVLSEYGKALTAVGRSSDALPFLSRAIQLNGRDWTTFSANGVALDQTGNHKSAQDNYQIALQMSPNNPAVQSNLAMSYVLSGQITQGEAILRKLVARPDATAQMRQNLAMIATLKGNKAEAEQLARQDLPPADAFNNMAVLRQFSATNAKVESRELPQPTAPAAPASKPNAPASPNSGPILIKPANTSVLPPPKGIMAPISDEPQASATPPATPAQTVLSTAPKKIIPPAAAIKKTPVTMAPIADEEAKATLATPAPSKPAAPTKVPTQNQAASPTPLRQSLNDEKNDADAVALANMGY